MGDPVREVKSAAIAALARLRDQGSVPLLRSLVLSRSEDQVAWEDEGSDWEEWLDVQTAAIRALGQIGAKELIDDLLTALFDTSGQSVDLPVYEALTRIREIGIAALLEIFDLKTGISRRRAGAALSVAAPEQILPHLTALLASDERQLRLLALGALVPDDPRCAALARSNADPLVRATALRKVAAAAPGLAQA